jgi:EAL domain-containing protein (putative c-di-GMP-specific phosphodiesterase class I)
LSYLNRFPLKVLKIDRAFIREILASQNSAAIATAIISIGHALELQVVAEGVETDAQLALLRSLECDLVQGYRISPPVPAEQVDSLGLS